MMCVTDYVPQNSEFGPHTGEDPGTWPQTSETAAVQGIGGEQGLPLLSLSF